MTDAIEGLVNMEKSKSRLKHTGRHQSSNGSGADNLNHNGSCSEKVDYGNGQSRSDEEANDATLSKILSPPVPRIMDSELSPVKSDLSDVPLGAQVQSSSVPPKSNTQAQTEKFKSNASEDVLKSVFAVACPRLIPGNYLEQGIQATAVRERRVRILLEERKWPKDGWDDLSIEMFIHQLAAMDSNNYITKVGVGEREARIYSPIVSKRHYGLCHGVGRSGDLAEAQPKAIGSSLMSSLVNALVLDVCKTLISSKVAAAFLSPMATGMSLTLVLLTLKQEKPKAKFVVWPRIDQKSSFKCIITAGLEPLIVEGKIEGKMGEVQTNVEELESIVKVYGADNILCFLTTTSCFAPRVPDSLERVSRLCASENIFHIVNNAYGLQNSGCAHQILEGSEAGRLDVFVQSTDKNLMVPVGGAIIAGFNKELVLKIRQSYPGRASSSQTLDILITLLSMGSSGYSYLVMKAKENYAYLKQSLEQVASVLNEKVIPTHNRISIAMTLNSIAPRLEPSSARSEVLTQLGSMLFRRHVGGCRVVTGMELKTIQGHQFRGWGGHCSNYPVPYLTAAATLGMERKDVDSFIKKLEECHKKLSTTFAANRVFEYQLGDVDVYD